MHNHHENSTENFGRSSLKIILKSKNAINSEILKQITKELLLNLGNSCTKKEGTIIGHIKCYIKTPEGFIRGSVVSMKTGPKIVGNTDDSIKEAEFALACIIFGLTDDEIREKIQKELSKIQEKFELLYQFKS
jgi:hypothetical protein